MAKTSTYEVTRICGHEEDIVLYQSRKRSEYRIAQEEEKICWECEKDQEYQTALSQNDGLPTLIGSEKQIKWAESIRRSKLDLWQEFVDKEVSEEDMEMVHEYTVKLEGKDSASWWINNRDKYIIDIAAKLG